ncbi:hypothetical protein LTR37_014916 [Vermiconidia calcicola]|uniref:Uncharacterized protein n=1 Tax=Vermiconidia calcicola TaxID=1690605 RepID=A0ACC3MSE7_9PEZI|nr:hypothetical protein LTR37_014916 [Vermiconidia calcicola]
MSSETGKLQSVCTGGVLTGIPEHIANLWWSFPVDDLLDDFSPEEREWQAETYECDLENDIHPIFSQCNFAGLVDYEALAPALKLASHLLLEPRLLKFWHGLLTINVHEVDHHSRPGQTYKAFFRKEGELTAKEIAETQYALVCLVNHRPATFGPELFEAWFDFATLLLHELVHAAHGAVCNAEFNQDLPLAFEHNEVSEEGFDWENFVFGGLPNHTNGLPTLTEWNGPRALSYVRYGALVFVADIGNAVEAPFVADWQIPRSFVRGLFTTVSWKTVVPTKGAEALKIPKILGHLEMLTFCNCCCCEPVRKCLDGTMADRTRQGDLIGCKAGPDCNSERRCAFDWFIVSSSLKGTEKANSVPKG